MLGIKEIGSFHIGGTAVALQGLPPRKVTVVPGSPPLTVDQNGEFAAWQMYVQYVTLAAPRLKLPLLLWHGGGLSGVAWETKPDGRPGWQTYFLAAGFDTYVSDAVERGRAGWARTPEIFAGDPFFMPKHAAWELYRIGPSEGFAERRTFKGGRFPAESFDRFAQQIVPRWLGHEARVQAAYDALVQRVGPCVLVAHSQGAGFAFTSTLRLPHLVKALVLIEPGGAPDGSSADFATMASVPILTIWGDFVDKVEFWAKARSLVSMATDRVARAGGDVVTIDLPARGIHGNSHLLMMDENSDELAELVRAWLLDRLGYASRERGGVGR